MLNEDCITKLLDLQEVSIKNVVETDKNIFIHISSTKNVPDGFNIHDYRTHKIKGGCFRHKHLYFILKKRRIINKLTGKITTEDFKFVAKRHRIHQNVFLQIIDKLREVWSMSSIAREYNISVSTVIRYFDLISYSKPSLENTTKIGIDEFKGNTGGYPYNVILTDLENGKVIDIIKTRDLDHLLRYFQGFKGAENIQYCVQDMWLPYKKLYVKSFKNGVIVIDKYHFVRQVTWAVENVRKREQRRLFKEERLFFKRSKRLLYKQYSKLTIEEKDYLFNIFSHSYDLEYAYNIKRAFEDFCKAKTREESRKELNIWIEMAKESNLPEFKNAITSFTNWKDEICNSKLIKETNGFTEGCNNKIKVLKRNAYGFQNFERFRNRILHVFG